MTIDRNEDRSTDGDTNYIRCQFFSVVSLLFVRDSMQAALCSLVGIEVAFDLVKLTSTRAQRTNVGYT